MADRRLVLVVFLLVLTAGCGGSGGGGTPQKADPGTGGPTGRETPATTTPAAIEATGEDTGSAPSIRSRRALIFTGRVELEVGDFEAARREIDRAVRTYGGYVSDASERIHRVENDTYTTGRLTLRVPRSNFSTVMERTKAVGSVIRASRESKDVTGRLVDIRARLRNLRVQRERLRELYRNAGDTEAVLQVEERLSEVQTEIERLEARRKDLEDRVAMSTIEVGLGEPRPDPEADPVERWYDTGVVRAFLDSVDGVVAVIRALVVAFAYALPYLVVCGIPLALLGYAFRRRRDWRA